jgi:hypothetical protein
MGKTGVELIIEAAILGEIENAEDGGVEPKKVNH